MPSVSVVIPAYRAAAVLPALLDSLKKQTQPPLEILVVDDDSGDETAEVAEALGARVIRLEDNGGPGPARNAGAAAAQGDILCFTDADCVVEPDWIAKQLAFMEARKARVTTSGYLGPAERDAFSLFQHWEKRMREPFYPAPIAAVNGHSLAVERVLYLEAGGMPDLRTSEDFAFGLVLSQKTQILFDPDNGVIHRFRPGLGPYMRQKRAFAKNSVLAAARYNWGGSQRATFSTSRTLGELSLSALAVLALGWSIWLAGAIFLVRILPVWLFLAGLKKQDAPVELFLWAAPWTAARDAASIAGMIEGAAQSFFGEREARA